MTRRSALDWNMNLKGSQIVLLFIFQSFFSLQILGNRPCDYYGTTKTYLDVAVDLIGKAKSHCLEGEPLPQEKSSLPTDCEEVLLSGHNRSGVYTIWPRNRLIDEKPLKVYCDMDTDNGGWTVIQRRGNFNKTMYYFYKDWTKYKIGFGDIEEDFWLGNDNIFALTNQRQYSVRFDLQNKEGETRHALYEIFWIDDENHKFLLHIEGYSGNAGDSMTKGHNNRSFSTKDQDNDYNNNASCAEQFKGGWWYDSCVTANLNGLYDTGELGDYRDGIRWNSFTIKNDTLNAVEIKIRAKNFKRKLIVKDSP